MPILALMLNATIGVLERERRHVPAEYEEDFRSGMRGWRMYYGEQIVERLRRLPACPPAYPPTCARADARLVTIIRV